MRRKPRKVSEVATERLRALAIANGILPAPGYTLWATHTNRGRCSYRHKTITVPVWAFDGSPRNESDPRYVLYYLAHECAHSFAGHAANHGPAFQAELIRLCPPDVVHYEQFYKPRRAKAAGITQGVKHATIRND